MPRFCCLLLVTCYLCHPSPRLRVISPHPPSRKARHPPPRFHPRKLCLRGARGGRWAFIRPMRRIIVILSTLGLWGLNHPAATRHPSAEGNFVLRREGSSSPIRRKGELFRDGTGIVPAIGGGRKCLIFCSGVL